MGQVLHEGNLNTDGELCIFLSTRFLTYCIGKSMSDNINYIFPWLCQCHNQIYKNQNIHHYHKEST